MCWVRSDGRIVYANEAACRSLGYSHEELVLMSVPDIDPGVPWSLWPAQWQKMKDAGNLTFEAQDQTREGRVYPVEITTNYIKANDQEFVWAHVRDITERKHAEEALASQEELYRTLVENIPDIIWVGDSEGQSTFLNKAWRDQTGREIEESLGQRWTESLHPDDAPEVLAKWKRASEDGEPYAGHCRFKVVDGSYRNFDFVGIPVRDRSGRVVERIGIARDITARKSTEALLRNSEERYRTIFEGAIMSHVVDVTCWAIFGPAEA